MQPPPDTLIYISRKKAMKSIQPPKKANLIAFLTCECGVYYGKEKLLKGGIEGNMTNKEVAPRKQIQVYQDLPDSLFREVSLIQRRESS